MLNCPSVLRTIAGSGVFASRSQCGLYQSRTQSKAAGNAEQIFLARDHARHQVMAAEHRGVRRHPQVPGDLA